jgi:hypothetical protein
MISYSPTSWTSSAVTPVSSSNSREAAFRVDSPNSTCPPGRLHRPTGGLARWMSRTFPPLQTQAEAPSFGNCWEVVTRLTFFHVGTLQFQDGEGRSRITISVRGKTGLSTALCGVNRRRTLTPGCLGPKYCYRKPIPVFSGVKIARRISHGIFFLSPYASIVYARNQVGSKFAADSQRGSRCLVCPSV